MLVLGRKIGERIVIDGDITITYLRDNCGYIHLGVEAPDHMNIVRGELLDQQRSEALFNNELGYRTALDRPED